MHTLLCVPIMVQDEPSALADVHAARDAGADLVEFRIDEVFSGLVAPAGGVGAAGEPSMDEREVALILRLVALSPLPCIVTCRSASEGGHYDGDDMARVSLYELLGTVGGRAAKASLGDPGAYERIIAATGLSPAQLHPPKYLDIEHAAYARSANLRQKVHLAVDFPHQTRDVRSGLILSMHDFKGRPADLLRRVADLQGGGGQDAARLIKIAYMARSIRDNLELLDIAGEQAGGRPTIALGMGRFGLMSRVLAPKFGGFLTFAALRPQSATAPGQPTVRELLDVYRFREINSRTRVYGLVGYPIEHSLSPLVHNAGFEAISPDSWDDPGAPGKHDGVYLPLPVPPEYEHFKATLSALIEHPKLDFGGCSVTIPHKQHLVRFAQELIGAGDEVSWEIDELSNACGAANTLTIERDRLGIAIRARVTNTDAPAAVGVLSEALGGSVAGKRVALVGAGGVSRAIAAGLRSMGATVVIYNRTPANAQRIADDLNNVESLRDQPGNLVAMELEAINKTCCDAIVNCTPVGMTGGPSPKESPVPIAELRRCSPEAVIMDTVYSPLRTPMLEQATLAGFRAIDGLGMFVRQAGMQFEQWTGTPAPLKLFERICREALES